MSDIPEEALEKAVSLTNKLLKLFHIRTWLSRTLAWR